MSSIRVRIGTITVAALTLVLAAAFPVQASAPPVQAAGLKNCIDTGGLAPCFEMVWANGVQLKMTFTNLNPKPSNAPTDNFYVVAPQTGTPQGTGPFPHDHAVGLSRDAQP